MLQTNISSILLSVNPYKALPLYGQNMMQDIRAKMEQCAAVLQLPPHPFSVAALAHQTLETGVNQSVIIR